ncbi:DUF1464 family protein [Methanonatronarchaeum thermophilum]
MKNLDCGIIFIPGVINLETVPKNRKVNKKQLYKIQTQKNNKNTNS